MGLTSPGLDDEARALVALAAAIAGGNTVAIASCITSVIAAGVAPLAVDELILQSVLTVGWPRALVAAGAWRTAIGIPAAHADVDLDYADHQRWTRRGEATCQVIYGDHYNKLRDNVRTLHPALEAWMITEGYGRTLSRPGLALKLRELCTAAQMMVLQTARQLHSHLLGALRAGATIAEVEYVLEMVQVTLPADERDTIAILWQRIRAAQESVA